MFILYSLKEGMRMSAFVVWARATFAFSHQVIMYYCNNYKSG